MLDDDRALCRRPEIRRQHTQEKIDSAPVTTTEIDNRRRAAIAAPSSTSEDESWRTGGRSWSLRSDEIDAILHVVNEKATENDFRTVSNVFSKLPPASTGPLTLWSKGNQRYRRSGLSTGASRDLSFLRCTFDADAAYVDGEANGWVMEIHAPACARLLPLCLLGGEHESRGEVLLPPGSRIAPVHRRACDKLVPVNGNGRKPKGGGAVENDIDRGCDADANQPPRQIGDDKKRYAQAILPFLELTCDLIVSSSSSSAAPNAHTVGRPA